MKFTKRELETLAALGAGFELDASKFTVRELESIATHSKAGKARLKIRNIEHLTLGNLQTIAACGSGCVFFELESKEGRS